jgi:two-component system, NtrC family, sensor kinase
MVLRSALRSKAAWEEAFGPQPLPQSLIGVAIEAEDPNDPDSVEELVESPLPILPGQGLVWTDLRPLSAWPSRPPLRWPFLFPLGLSACDRALLAVLMLKDETLVGAIMIYRQETGRAFTDKQIRLVQNFAAQAVIAIENVRLLNELRQRTSDLSESLEQQTATSQVLSVISSSPANIQPVLEIIGERARSCAVRTLSVINRRGRANPCGLDPQHDRNRGGGASARISVHRLDGAARAIRTRGVCHVTDVLNDPQYQLKDTARVSGFRGCLGVPMIRDEQVVGAIFVARRRPGLFSDAQVQLLKTFADQAVIAIENVRLFNETKNSLEQQTATARRNPTLCDGPPLCFFKISPPYLLSQPIGIHRAHGMTKTSLVGNEIFDEYLAILQSRLP